MKKNYCMIIIFLYIFLLVGCKKPNDIDIYEKFYGTYTYVGFAYDSESESNLGIVGEPELFWFGGEYSNEKRSFGKSLRDYIGDVVYFTSDYLQFSGSYTNKIAYSINSNSLYLNYDTTPDTFFVQHAKIYEFTDNYQIYIPKEIKIGINQECYIRITLKYNKYK